MHEIYRVIKHTLDQHGLILFATICASLAAFVVVRFFLLLLEIIIDMSSKERWVFAISLMILY
jgi:hypothetical protein